MPILENIKQMIEKGEIDRAFALLQAYIQENQCSEEVYFLLGNIYRKKENWQEALNNYRQAIDLNPDSPAKYAYQMIQEILAFYNKDMYNQ